MRRALAALAAVAALGPATALAQPGPNEPTSQGSGRNEGGDNRSDEDRPTNEDGSPSKGFVYAREDGSFALGVRAQVQARAVAGGAELEELDERRTEGFSIARARAILQGYAKKVWLYRLQLGAAPADLSGSPSSPLLDAHVTWAEVRDLRIRAGQMQVPFDRQNLISATSLQTVARSLVANEFALGRDIGVLLLSNDLFGFDRRITYSVGLFGGTGPNRTDGWRSPLAVARIELSPLGDFDGVVEADLERRHRPKLTLAIAAARQWNADRISPSSEAHLGAREEVTHAALDAKAKWRGASALVQLYARRGDEGSVAPGDTRLPSAVGYFVQAGYMLTSDVEVAARWGGAHPRSPAGRGSLRELAGAASYYVKGNDIKLQIEIDDVVGDPCSGSCTQGLLQMQMSL